MKSTLAKKVKTTEATELALKKPAERKGKNGWLKLAGWAKDDPLYDEAMKLGAEWRKTS